MPGTASLRDRDPSAPSTFVGAAKVAGGGLALWAGVQLLAAYLERRAVLSAMLQAALAEWGCGHMGIAWSNPLGPIPTSKDVLRRVARGVAYGGATAFAVVAAAVVTRAATATLADSPSVGMLTIGLFTSMLAAVRDELILRGVVLRATRGLASRWISLLACGMAAGAAHLGVDGVVGMALAAEALRGVALAALWVQDAGVWMAWAANAAWMWTLGSAAHGGLLDVRFATDADGAASTIFVLAIVALLAADPRRLSRRGLR